MKIDLGYHELKPSNTFNVSMENCPNKPKIRDGSSLHSQSSVVRLHGFDRRSSLTNDTTRSVSQSNHLQSIHGEN